MFGKSKRQKQKPSANSTASTSGAAAASPKKMAPSVISADMHVLGNIISEGMIDIDGHIEGNVKCENAVVRTNGNIRGDVVATEVQIYGRVEGLVKAAHVTLYQSAHVIGIIMHESLSIEDGAFVDGKFKRTDRVFVEEAPAADLDEDEAASSEPEESVMDNLRLISN